jgi:hypothetical protein
VAEPIELVGIDAEDGRVRRVLGRAFSKVDREQFVNEWSFDQKRVRVVTEPRAFKQLTGSSCPFAKARGYRFETENGPVIATYDLTYMSKGKMHLLPVLVWDLHTAIKERELLPVQWPIDDLTLRPDPWEFEEWCRQAKHSSFLVHDLETPYSKSIDDDSDEEDPSYEILRFSLARDDFKAITAPYSEPYISLVKEIMGEPMPKVGWNSQDFDDPREYANGWPMRGKRIDGQWLWHFLQSTLPRGLGAVTTYYDRVPEWKSIGAGQDSEGAELYSCMDSRETAKNFVGIKRALEARAI